MLYGIISVAIGLIFYMTIQFGGENYIERVYMSEDRAQKRMDRLVDKFSRFVYSEDVNSYDYEEIKEWCKKQDNAYLMIFNSDGELTFETDGTMSSVYPNGESDSTAGGSATYRISFEDGDYDLVMIEFSEYEYYDGNIYIISEGGLKFIGLSENKKVCICIYEDYTNMNNLCGLQISGNSEILEPWCEEYMETLDRKGLKIENILKLPFNMNIIKVIPDKYEFLYSKFKNLGFDSKQTYIPNK